MGFKGVNIKGIDKVQKDFQTFLDSAKQNPAILQDVGDTAVKYIRGSVRSRREDYKLGDLLPKTEALRKALTKYNQVDATSSPKRSNMTFTGELLNNMKYRFNSRAKSVTIFFDGTHKQLKGKNGQDIGKAQTNSQIASKLNSNPKFHFLFASDKLKTILKNRIVAGIRRQLSNYRKARKLLNR